MENLGKTPEIVSQGEKPESRPGSPDKLYELQLAHHRFDNKGQDNDKYAALHEQAAKIKESMEDRCAYIEQNLRECRKIMGQQYAENCHSRFLQRFKQVQACRNFRP